jgi:hypothetical protein
MKIYHIAGKQYGVHGEELYERMSELNPVIVSVSEPESTSTFALKRNKAVKRQKTSGGRRMMHCKVCDGYGHMAKTCPDRKPEAEKIKHGQDESLVETADLRTQVQERKAGGETSIQIAKALGVSLAEINRNW